MSQLGIEMASEDGGDAGGARGARAQRHGRRRQRRRRRRSLVALVVALAVFAALGTALYAGGRAVFDRVQEALAPPLDYEGPGSGQVQVTVPSGATIREIGGILTAAGVVGSEDAFVTAAEANANAAGIQAGDYVLASRMRASDAIEAMLTSTTVTGQVLVPEGYRLTQIVQRVAEQGGFDPAAVEQAVASAPLPAAAQGQAEGFLFPATYDLRPDSTAESVVTGMVRRFEQAAETVDLAAAAQARGLTERELVTVASIIQREVRREADMPAVAEVIYNRLSGACSANGVPRGLLQMDSTVHYFTGDYGSVYTSDEQRATDDPYNTYLRPGLPPGPIASPGETALRAASAPSGGGYCYFVTVDLETGETAFAVTQAEHDANVARCRQSDAC